MEGNCALWDSRYEQCSIKTACENIGNPTTSAKKPKAVSDILAKIRSKKKPEVLTPATSTTPTTAATPTDTADTPVATEEKPKQDLLVAPAISATKLPIVTSEADSGPSTS